MDEDKRDNWDRVLGELKNPWDWTAAIAGGSGGAVFTVLMHGLDLGHSIPTGALGAVTARRAVVAGLQGRTLSRRSERLSNLLERRRFLDLQDLLLSEKEKWEGKISSNERFAEQIDEISDLESRRTRRNLLGNDGSNSLEQRELDQP